MSALQRSVTLTLIVGIAITGGYIVYTQRHPQSVFGRTPLNHILGLLGFAAIVGVLCYRARPLLDVQTADTKISVWHMTIGNLAPLLVLLHSGFQLSSLTSIVAVFCLTMLIVSGMVSILGGSQLDTPDSPGRPRADGLRSFLAKQYWVDLHIYLSAIVFAFSLVHILVILYY